MTTEQEMTSSEDHMTGELDSDLLLATSGDHVTGNTAPDLLRGFDSADSTDIDRLFDSFAPNLTGDTQPAPPAPTAPTAPPLGSY